MSERRWPRRAIASRRPHVRYILRPIRLTISVGARRRCVSELSIANAKFYFSPRLFK